MKKTQMSILYDDFYNILYDYLNLQDKIRFSQTCASLETIFVQYVHKRMPRLLNNKLIAEIIEYSPDDIRYFWRHYGPCVESIEFISEYGRNCKFNKVCDAPKYKHCTKVRRLKIWGLSRINCRQFLNTSNIHTITEVDLRASALGDTQMKYFTNLRNLKVLSLSQCSITGKYLNRMRKIKHLTLRHCWNLEQDAMVKICKDLHLLYLDVRNTYGLVLNDIVAHCGDLEHLRYSWDINICVITHYGITSLPKLKSLTIFLRRWLPIDHTYFRLLANHHSKDLQEVTISLSKQGDEGVNIKETPFYLDKLKYFQTIFQKGFYGLDENEVCKNSIMRFKMDEYF